MTLRERVFVSSDPVAGSHLLHARLEPPIRTVCAWCDLELQPGPPAPVSHGCCPSCLERLLAA